jgi:hypothetical protein
VTPLPPHEARITALVLEAVASRPPAAQAQTFRDLAQLTRCEAVCVELMQLAERAEELARDSRQLCLRLTPPA